MVKGKLRKLCEYFAHLRPCREGLRANVKGKTTAVPKVIFRPVIAKDDEARCRHPMYESFEDIEADNLAPRTSALDLHHAAPQIEDDEKSQHAKDSDPTDPAQRHAVKLLPVASHRVLEHVGPYVRNGAAALESS